MKRSPLSDTANCAASSEYSPADSKLSGSDSHSSTAHGSASVGSSPFCSGPTGKGSSRRPSLYTRLLQWVLRLLLAVRYRVEVQGLKTIHAHDDGRPLLFLPSHSALVDPLLIYSLLADYRPRAMADSRQVDKAIIRTLIRPFQPIIIPDLLQDAGRPGQHAEKAVRAALDASVAALKQGDNLLLYPAGRLTRDGHDRLDANSGAHALYSCVPECRVVLVRIRGLWGSSFSYAPCTGHYGDAPHFFKALSTAAARLLCNALLFMPRRPVRIVFEEAHNLPPAADGTLSFNRCLESFYQAEAQPVLCVPYYFWQGSTVTEKPLVPTTTVSTRLHSDALKDISDDLKAEVMALLAQSVYEDSPDRPDTPPSFALSDSLSADLGIDSLSLSILALRLEERFGYPVQRLDLLHRVGDCVLAAAGKLEGTAPVTAPPPQWHAAQVSAQPQPLELAEGTTIPAIFVRQMRRDPARLLLGDASGAALSRRDVLLRALALASHIRTLPGHRVGIMLPASSAAAITWLAVLLSGKCPVLCNWTTGESNLRHCLSLAQVEHVLTARQLLSRLEQQGFRPQTVGTQWICLEDVAAQLSIGQKLQAACQMLLARCGLLFLSLPPLSSTAALLFTSGSESLPKAVPLSHANILANCRAVAEVLRLHSADTMLAMLPPFHSLGLTGNIVVPLVFGMPAVYHANPTEAARLNEICRLWHCSITISPPTFLEAMLQRAQQGDLASLRLGFVGAEKCSQSVYDAFATQTGGVLCEGYGVTECSPGVCVNPPDDPRPGTIGRALPLEQLAIVVQEANGSLRRALPDEQGQLLVNGPNVFAGYLPPPACMAHLPQPADPFVLFEGRRWYGTGDMVSTDAGGHLTFRGRLKRFVKLGGEMISLPQMESVLLAAFEFRRDLHEGPLLAVESHEEAEKPVISLFSVLPLSREEANTALRQAGLSGLYAVQRVRQVEAIPVLGTGKTDYRRLKAL